MTAPMIKEGWVNALEPGIKGWFQMAVMDYSDPLMALYSMVTSNRSAEHISTYGGISPDSWDEFEKTRAIPAVGVDAGYKTDFTMLTKIVELPIQRELFADEQYGLIQMQVENLGRAAARKKIFDATSVFNNAFSSSFAGADGVALCSDSHPSGPRNATTQDNNYTLALSKANVATIRENAFSIKDDKGNYAGIVYDTIIVPPALEDTMLEITETPLDPTSANNTINTQAKPGRWKGIMSPYLSDTNAWFMIDSNAMKNSLFWFDREHVNMSRKVQDENAFITWVVRMRYALGFTDWRWIAGSNPS
jgi:phage major head subunit gpT-like protein